MDQCWFCEDNLENIKNADTFKMYKEISRVSPVVGEANVKFSTMKVTVYRCDKCYKKVMRDEKTDGMYSKYSIILAIISAVIGFFVFWNGEFLSSFFASFLIFGLGGWFIFYTIFRIWDYIKKHWIRGEKHEFDHPIVRHHERQGWQTHEPAAY